MSRYRYELCLNIKHRWGPKMKGGKLKRFLTFFLSVGGRAYRDPAGSRS